MTKHNKFNRSQNSPKHIDPDTQTYTKQYSTKLNYIIHTTVVLSIHGLDAHSSINYCRLSCMQPQLSNGSCFAVSHIVDISRPNITMNKVEQFTNEVVNVLLEWTIQREIHGLMYNISILPQANIQYDGIRTARLSLSYNISYNVILLVICGESLSALPIELYYGKSI